ncbi:MAG: hypothetical protein M3Q56_11415 [Bacteroidota bacterium]|nr:hypothetical protein [Bacteroidota bacterium]
MSITGYVFKKEICPLCVEAKPVIDDIILITKNTVQWNEVYLPGGESEQKFKNLFGIEYVPSFVFSYPIDKNQSYFEKFEFTDIMNGSALLALESTIQNIPQKSKSKTFLIIAAVIAAFIIIKK